MKCRKCGASVPTDSLYCNYCGAKIIRTTSRDDLRARPREENFDDITTAKDDRVEAENTRGQRFLTIAMIFLAGAVIAGIGVTVFQIMKSHQRTIVTPGTSAIEEGTLSPITEAEPTAEAPSSIKETTAETYKDGDTFEYQNITYLVSGGTLTLNRCRGMESILELPTEIHGMKLTAIGKGAFYGCSHLQYIDIPEGVTVIGDEAFSYCSNLREIVLPTTLSDFGANVFDYAGAYTFIVIPGTI